MTEAEDQISLVVPPQVHSGAVFHKTRRGLISTARGSVHGQMEATNREKDERQGVEDTRGGKQEGVGEEDGGGVGVQEGNELSEDTADSCFFLKSPFFFQA